jgi:S-adenosylmethionine:tRNA-ribosyltransferase-isomerase (queuine synthetase)
LRTRLGRATASTQEGIPLVTQLFDQLYCAGAEYRSTMVVLGRLESDRERQRELFEDNLHIEKLERASATIDAVNKAYGKHKLCLGTALFLNQPPHGP